MITPMVGVTFQRQGQHQLCRSVNQEMPPPFYTSAGNHYRLRERTRDVSTPRSRHLGRKPSFKTKIPRDYHGAKKKQFLFSTLTTAFYDGTR